MKNLLFTATLLLSVASVLAKETPAHPDLSARAPLSFIENKGQIIDQYGKHRNDIDFKLDAGGMVLFIGNGQLHYQWQKSFSFAPGSTGIGSFGNAPREGDFDPVHSNENTPPPLGVGQEGTPFYRMDVTLVGASKYAKPIAEEQQVYEERYYLPQCPKGAIAKSYTRIVYQDIYPHVDWIIYVNKGSLKYDFVVNKGGNPADIKLQYNGATSLQLVAGSLVAETPYGKVTENVPYTYNAETRQQIPSSFHLDNNILSYDLPQSKITNHSAATGQIIIDPLLRWATYYGGNTSEYQNGTSAAIGWRDDYTYSFPWSKAQPASDGSDNIYIAGVTKSTSNIATSGAYRSTYVFISAYDAFLAKFNSAGNIVWATYYGGPTDDWATNVACDPSGNVYIAGNTNSTSGISVGTAHQGSKGSGGSSYDGFLVKFNSSGTPQWGTYYGGSTSLPSSPDTHVSGLACDANGNIYICGGTSADGSGVIATSGSYLSSIPSGGTPAFYIAKFNSSGARQWGTYVPSVSGAQMLGLTCDGSGNPYVYGSAGASGYATAGAFQGGLSGSAQSGFLMKFTNAGTSLLWGTYYGAGAVQTWINTATCDAAGNVFIGGNCRVVSASNTFATGGAYQSSFGGGSFSNGNAAGDGFLAKFNSSGVRQWGTFFGGAGEEAITGMAVDRWGNLYASGGTTSGSSIAPSWALFPSLNGSSDAFIATFSNGGAYLNSTYFGGTGVEGMTNGITVTNSGLLLLSGGTSSASGLATTGAYQTTFGGVSDRYLTSMYVDTQAVIKQPYIDTLFCPGDSFKLRYDVTEKFRNGNTFTVQLSNAAGSFAAPTVIGSLVDSLADSIRCMIPRNAVAGTAYRVRIISTNPVRTSFDNLVNIRIKAGVANFTTSSNTPACEGDTIRLNASTSSSGATWAWTGPVSYTSTNQNNKIGQVSASMAGKYGVKVTLTSTGCSLTDTQNITVNPTPAKPIVSSNTPICFGATLNLNATTTTSGVTYSWTGPNSFTSAVQNPSKTSVVVADGGNYIVTATLNGCSRKDTTNVVVYSNVPTPLPANNGPLCIGSNIALTVPTIAGASGYAWSGPNGFTSNVQNPTIASGQTVNAGTYSVTATVNGCNSAPGGTVVTMVQGPSVLIYPSPSDSICLGKPITLVALPANPGAGATYQWLRNGSNAFGSSTGLTYSMSGVVDGDTFSIVLTPGTGAACTTPVNSNKIGIHVLQYQTPFVSISSSDTGSNWPGVLINFHGTAGNAGTYPKYQWKLNGANVNGATDSIWGATMLHDKDSVCIEVTSSYICPSPAKVKACTPVKIATGIHDVTTSGIVIVPNPFHEELAVYSSQLAGAVGTSRSISGLQLMDVLGRVVYSGVVTGSKTVINTSQLVSGNYVLVLTDKDGNKNTWKVVKE